MKTKLLLSTVALAAVFAGCSNEEWGSNNAPSTLDNRRSAGKVEISLPDVSTRMEETADGLIVFSEDDRIAATLMDEFNGTYPISNFVNYIQTNYPFYKSAESGIWESEGVLLEGNYFFSYPFSACVQNRGALTNTVPVDQLAYNPETGKVSTMQSYVDNQFYVGYSYIEADGSCTECNEIPALKANVKLEKVHAYPVFRFINQTGAPESKPLKIYKISLRKQDHSMFYNTVAVFPKTKEFNPATALNESGKYDLWYTAVYNRNMPGNEETDIDPFDCSVVGSTTLEYNLLFPEGGYELANWTSFEAAMVVPAGVYGPMEVVLYTNEGVGTYPVFMPETGEDYQVQSGMYKLTPAKKSLTTIRFDITSLKTNQTDIVVQSTENLLEYLKYYHMDPDGVSGNAVKLNITTVGDKVELSQEVYDELKNLNLKINIDGIITIPEGVPADAIDRINYFAAGAKVINNGTQVIKEIPASDKNILDSNVKIVNNGTLTLDAKLPQSIIKNYGTLIVEEADVLSLVNIDGTLTVNGELNAICLRNFSTATINKEATVNVLEKFINAGELTNDGTLNTWPMDIVLKLIPVNVREESKLTENDFAGKGGNGGHNNFNKYVLSEKLLLVSNAKAINDGLIENNGTIDCNGIAKVEKVKEIYGKVIGIPEQLTCASVSSLVNVSEINNNNGGRITNLTNIGWLTPDVNSYTSLVIIEVTADMKDVMTKLKDVLVGKYVRGKFGYIDMSKNDGKDYDDQAVIRDNITKKDIEPFGEHNQIIFVLRNAVKFDALPKYVNTIWLYNAEGTVSADTDIKQYSLWLDGNNTITVANEKSLTLGYTEIGNEKTTFKGNGTVKLTDDVYVFAGTTLTVDNTWTAEDKVNINANGATLVEGGEIDETNITINKTSLVDYVGPWVIIK